MNTLRCWKMIHLETAWELGTPLPPSPCLSPCIPSFWLLLSSVLYNTLINVSKVTSSVQWAILVNYQTLGRAHGNPRLECWSEVQVTTWALQFVCEEGQSCGTEPFSSGVCTNLCYQVVLVVKNPPADAGDAWVKGLIPGSGRSLGGGHGNALQYSCLENPMDRAAWWGRKESDTTEAT